MIISGVAKRYALAFFEIGLEEGNYRDPMEELEGFCAILRKNEMAKTILDSSVYNEQEKKSVLHAVLEARTFSDITTRFLILVLEKGRMPYITQILDGYKTLLEAHEGIERIEVTVPSPLDESQRSDILSALSESMGKKIEIEEKVAPSIIGGLIIKAGSTVYDGSIKTQIHKLGENLKKGR